MPPIETDETNEDTITEDPSIDYQALTISDDELPELKEGESYKGIPHPDKLYLPPEARMHMKNMQAQMTRAAQEAARHRRENEALRQQLRAQPPEVAAYVQSLQKMLVNEDGSPKTPDITTEEGLREGQRLESVRAFLEVEQIKTAALQKQIQEEKSQALVSEWKAFTEAHEEDFADPVFFDRVLDLMDKGLDIEDAYLVQVAKRGPTEQQKFQATVSESNRRSTRAKTASSISSGNRIAQQPDLSDATSAWEIAQRLYPDKLRR